MDGELKNLLETGVGRRIPPRPGDPEEVIVKAPADNLMIFKYPTPRCLWICIFDIYHYNIDQSKLLTWSERFYGYEYRHHFVPSSRTVYGTDVS